MRKIYLVVAALFFVVFVALNAHALSIYPGLEIDSGPIGEANNQSSNKLITDYLFDEYGLASPLYKSNFGGNEEGILMGSYETDFFNSTTDPSDATITYIGGDFVGPIAYLVVKDGNHSPFWYLFNLTNLNWNGTDTLNLSGFWAEGGGAISHVSLYGNKAQVPEPTTLLLLGAGIAGLAVYRRRRS